MALFLFSLNALRIEHGVVVDVLALDLVMHVASVHVGRGGYLGTLWNVSRLASSLVIRLISAVVFQMTLSHVVNDALSIVFSGQNRVQTVIISFLAVSLLLEQESIVHRYDYD